MGCGIVSSSEKEITVGYLMRTDQQELAMDWMYGQREVAKMTLKSRLP